jgi:hypothetical protein
LGAVLSKGFARSTLLKTMGMGTKFKWLICVLTFVLIVNKLHFQVMRRGSFAAIASSAKTCGPDTAVPSSRPKREAPVEFLGVHVLSVSFFIFSGLYS